MDGNLAPQIESACVLLSYLADALHSINTTQPHGKFLTHILQFFLSPCSSSTKLIHFIYPLTAWRSVSPTWESPSDLGFDFDYTDEQQDDDDTSADDSVSISY